MVGPRGTGWVRGRGAVRPASAGAGVPRSKAQQARVRFAEGAVRRPAARQAPRATRAGTLDAGLAGPVAGLAGVAQVYITNEKRSQQLDVIGVCAGLTPVGAGKKNGPEGPCRCAPWGAYSCSPICDCR